jgi:hypothetical protein
MLKKNITRAIFALTIVFLFLPIGSISAAIINVKLTGIQFITGVSSKFFFGSNFGGISMPESQVIPPNAFIIIALAVALFGLAGSFIFKRKSDLIIGICGGVGVLSFIIFSLTIRDLIGGIVVDMEFGFFVEVILFALVVIVSFLRFGKKANNNLFENEYHTVDENLDLRPEIEPAPADEPSVNESPDY